LRLKSCWSSWAALTQEAFRRERDALPYRRMPLRDILRPHGLGLETAFNFVDFHIYERVTANQAVSVLSMEGVENTNLALEIGVAPGVLQVHTRGLVRGTAARVAAAYLRALEILADDPTLPVRPEHLLAEGEGHSLLRAARPSERAG